ncbi:Diguanylate phosphodiesterase [Beijerinckiaceae bacterium RH AL1]|nr:sensor domain-containing diguanylate cyclase [Beijerinckiaceae bacterium]VVB45855.1 Diguanylate phosphodiesterase [Beijerinckiaceae bacterium RH CH11]VVB45933.1 Diguanylate phosphodiesterase [Beijerinckiaceae bacterium RH AL8]VVC55075.1 Diguanylate phosphodiesterase [Beijerinckiaceae bacterium RH AL1]
MPYFDQLDSDRRLSELDRYDVLGTPAEEAFDRVTRLVCRLFNVPMSTVTFIDGHRQWFKSRQGLDACETARDMAFCRVPTATGEPLVVRDTLADPHFRDNRLVTGEPFLRFYAGVPIRSARNVVVGTLCAMDVVPRPFEARDLDLLCDLARLVETELELRVQASTDGLTQLLTRRAFVEEAERAIALATRHRYDLSCIVFDIDHFKVVNDEKGHATGDAVLREIARTARETLRRSDLIGRLGGEEFAILLPHTGPADALNVAEKLRAAIAARTVRLGDDAVRVTASFGVAQLAPARPDVDGLLDHADQAMYQAKNRGRDCCIMWEGEREERTGLSRRVLKAGKIVFNLGRSSIDCTVKRMSEGGARLDVESPSSVPREFKLSITADAFSRKCTIVDQRDRQLEVVFR